MRQNLTRIGVAALTLLLVVGFAPRPTKADSLTISPPEFELLGNPGDTLSEKIKVTNTSDTDITYLTDIQDFRAEGDDGSIDLVDPETSKESFSLARWLTTEPSQFTVPANQEKVVTVTVRIPKTAEPGGHFASVLIRRQGTPVSGGTSVQSRIGTLFLLRVSGAATEKLSLNSFLPENSYQQYGPVTFNMRYTNAGNVHVAPTGTIVITNMFGHKIKEIPVSPVNILPDSDRLVKTVWDEKNLVGRYTASLVVTYGQSKQTIAASTTFVVFPVYLMVIIVVVLILLYLLIAKRKSLKRLINNLTSE